MNQHAIIVHLLREGQWQQAVMLYREEMGVPRRIATKEIERLAEQHHIRPPRLWSWWPHSTTPDFAHEPSESTLG